MKKYALIFVILCLLLCIAGCGGEKSAGTSDGNAGNTFSGAESTVNTSKSSGGAYTVNTKISDVISDPVFGDYGRLIFPVDSGYYSGDTLGELRLTWYSNIDADKTVEIASYMKTHATAGETIFYDIYTEAEKDADPDKRDTGLFFFRGEPGARLAICNAGGGFSYVGAMHDSFPHALELSKKGYNAFALIYRPTAPVKPHVTSPSVKEPSAAPEPSAPVKPSVTNPPGQGAERRSRAVQPGQAAGCTASCPDA